ncbi:MAG: hypothetical protein H6757_00010 [Candidatus Omnitrophica bacterium]|nr:hypothetical protein [Candidatus Omnitrophota bacterium]
MGGYVKMFVTDFITDAMTDDMAFGINFEVHWPGSTNVSYVRVSFQDEFIEKMFNVPWNQDLGEVTKKLVHEQREIFIKWALLRLELWVVEKDERSKLYITLDKHRQWAQAVMDGSVSPASEQVDEKSFRYWIRDEV